MTVTYNPESGQIFKDGVPSGTRNASGYVVLRHEGRVVYAHRLAWFLTHGVWPKIIDHVSGDRSDNRIANLREVTASGNAQNMVGRRAGAHFHKPSGLWKSAIRNNGRSIHLGYYPSADHATEAYILVKEMIHSNWKGNHHA
jgi:hypothetical protein